MIRVFLEFFDVQDIHSCTCVWRAISIFLVVMGRCLKVSLSGGSPLKDTSWTIPARALMLNVHVRLTTMGVILTFTLRLPWV